MFYVCGEKRVNKRIKLAVKDTVDGVVEYYGWYSLLDFLKKGVRIVGVSLSTPYVSVFESDTDAMLNHASYVTVPGEFGPGHEVVEVNKRKGTVSVAKQVGMGAEIVEYRVQDLICQDHKILGVGGYYLTKGISSFTLRDNYKNFMKWSDLLEDVANILLLASGERFEHLSFLSYIELDENTGNFYIDFDKLCFRQDGMVMSVRVDFTSRDYLDCTYYGLGNEYSVRIETSNMVEVGNLYKSLYNKWSNN